MEETTDNNVIIRERIENACKAVQMENFPIRAAARQFGISSTTIHRHLKNPAMKNRGRPKKFTTAEYDVIADLLLRFAEVGGNLNRDLMLKVVLAVGKAKGLNESHNKFSNHWSRSFLARYPAVAARLSRKKPGRWDADKWNQLMEELEKDAFLEDPRALFPYSPDGIRSSPKKRISRSETSTAVQAVAKVVAKTPQQRVAEKKKKMKAAMKEIWGDDLAEADIVRLVNEADFMARGLIPSVRHCAGPPKDAVTLVSE